MIRDEAEYTVSFWTDIMHNIKTAPAGHIYHFKMGPFRGTIVKYEGDAILCSTESMGFGIKYKLISISEMLSQIKSGLLLFAPHPNYRFALKGDYMKCDKCGGDLEY